MISSPREFYARRAVADRLMEYCGAPAGGAGAATAHFLISDGDTASGLGIPTPDSIASPAAMARLAERGKDIFRSLWDDRAAVAVMDLDYHNFDRPDEAFHNPAAIFDRIEPVYAAAEAELTSLGIDHITLMTGQGYHMAWRIPDGTPAGQSLAQLASPAAPLAAKYAHDHPLTGDLVPAGKGAAHTGLGLALEYLAHRLLRRVRGQAGLPVVTTGLVVGPGNNGREAVSIDLSAFGDPLYLRYTRCAFSLYRRPSLPRHLSICVPRHGTGWKELLDVRASLELAADLAGETAATIPDPTPGSARLLQEYLDSDLRKFHVAFERDSQDEPARWPAGYDRFDLQTVPPCVALPLARPNDAIARPTNIQNVARVLVASGWRPRSVAGLIRSKFERDYGWGINWLMYDAATRADFYVRLYCGLVYCGLDDLVDFNCVSHQEKGFCPRPWCGFSLGSYREQLLQALRP